MKLLTLYIDASDWSVGHNGQFPKLIEWDLDDTERPLHVSEGWGHGLGGGQFSLEAFITSEWFDWLNRPNSLWAKEITSPHKSKIGDSPNIGPMLLQASAHHTLQPPYFIEQNLPILSSTEN